MAEFSQIISCGKSRRPSAYDSHLFAGRAGLPGHVRETGYGTQRLEFRVKWLAMARRAIVDTRGV
jgi:hypothetical protein